MKVLVTGSDGNVSNQIVKNLLKTWCFGSNNCDLLPPNWIFKLETLLYSSINSNRLNIYSSDILLKYYIELFYY